MVEHTQIIRRQQSANCLSVFDHLVRFGALGVKDKKLYLVKVWAFLELLVLGCNSK